MVSRRAAVDSEAERAVIGACLLDNSALDRISVQADDFDDPRYRAIWPFFRRLRAEEVVIDLVTVADAMGRTDVMDVLHECVGGQFSADNIEHYAEIVQRSSAARRLAKAMTDAASELQSGTDPDAVIDRVRKKMRKKAAKKDPATAIVLAQDQDAQALVLQTDSPLTVANVIRENLRGVVVETADELEEPPEIEWNEMSGQIEIDRKPLEDWQLSAIGIRMEERFKDQRGRGMKQSMTDLHRGMEYVARKQSYHPVVEYLKGCEAAWDGNARTAMLLEQGLRIRPDELSVTMLRHWLTGAVIRAQWPGSKMDNLLLLIGAQGLHKSQFLRALGEPWYIETDIDPGHDDAPSVMRMGWIVDWAEMESMLRARDQTTVKGFITRQSDPYRSKYARFPMKNPRGFVLAASTNNDCPLTDPTGNRRTWPLLCLKEIDVEFVTSVRDQIWGEASRRVRRLLEDGTIKVKNGAITAHPKTNAWWLSKEEDEELKKRQGPMEQQHPWAPLVYSYVEGRAEVTMEEIFTKAIEKPKGHWKSNEARDVADILRADGWIKHSRWKPRGNVWRKDS